MATATELLRAAEHMRGQADAIAERDAHDDFGRGHVRYWVRNMADALEDEARRVQAAEAAAKPRVPFAVLKRAYEQLKCLPIPSTRWMEHHGERSQRAEMADLRLRWSRAVENEIAAAAER